MLGCLFKLKIKTKRTMKTKEEILLFIRRNMPIMIRSKVYKKHFIHPFVSGHAQNEVCEHLAEKLLEELNKKI